MLGKIKILSRSRYLVRRLQTSFVVSSLRGKNNGLVADIGGGKSPYRKFVPNDKYLVLDVEDRVGKGEVIIADLNDRLPLEDNFVDTVLCIEVLEHIKKPQNALNEIHRVLKPGGKLILTTPMLWPEHEIPNDFYRYTKYSLEYLLITAGFSEVKINLSNGYFYTLCQLVLLRTNSWFMKPVIVLVNILGFALYKVEKNRYLPLGIQVLAYKH